ncbi:MAG: hypothetical protein QOF89_4963 [Acidobacteriota bacterium]|nr:hypothetical protein [Acidobacteriota bacterium]
MKLRRFHIDRSRGPRSRSWFHRDGPQNYRNLCRADGSRTAPQRKTGPARWPGPSIDGIQEGGYCAGQMMAPVLLVVQPPVSERTRMIRVVVLEWPRLSVTVSRAV